jgi:hypothetical protein
MAWYLDKGLAVLRDQLKKAHPGIVIGTIGNESHSNSTSDHNPEADGSVDAIDPMIGNGYSHTDAQRDVDSIIASHDPRILYVIWNGRICSSVVSPWVWRNYGGSDRHTNHWHLSVNDKNENKDLRPWRIYMEPEPRVYTYRPIEGNLPELRMGDEDPVPPSGTRWVQRAQRILGVESDGVYGPATAARLAEFMAGDPDRSSDNGRKLYIPEWRRLYAVW